MATLFEKVAKLRLKYDPAFERVESDDTLALYLQEAGEAIVNRAFPFSKERLDVPLKYENKQIAIAIYLLNKRGAEGQLAHNELGISRTYESGDVPESMLIDIIPKIGV